MSASSAASSAATSLYDVLGVKRTDSCGEIKKAFLKLARTCHPDKGGDPERFKELLRASEILTDESRRRLYDSQGITDDHPLGGGGGGMSGFPGFEMNLNDLFGGIFGGMPTGMGPGGQNGLKKGRKPAPAIQTLPITLDQFYLGHEFTIQIHRHSFCSACDHTGASSRELCKTCGGMKSVTQVVQIGPMTMHSVAMCQDCQGKGERVLETCGVCKGSGFGEEKRQLTVTIPPGTKAGEVYIYPEVCSDQVAFEKPGDVHLQLIASPSDSAFRVFQRVGDQQQHLETTVTLSLAESLVGCVIVLEQHPGYEEGLFLRIPAGSFHGDRYRVIGKGMPIPGNVGQYGDLHVRVTVQISPTERSLFGTKGREALMGLFAKQVRVVSPSATSVVYDSLSLMS